MTAPKTAVPAIRAWLVQNLPAFLAAQAGDTESGSTTGSRGIDVVDMYPLADSPNDVLAVGAANVTAAPYLLAGSYIQGTFMEKGTVQLELTVYGEGSETPTDLLTRAYGWVDAIGECVMGSTTRDGVSIGGNAIAAWIEQHHGTVEEDEHGPIANVTMSMHYEAEI